MEEHTINDPLLDAICDADRAFVYATYFDAREHFTVGQVEDLYDELEVYAEM